MEHIVPGVLQRLRAADIMRMAGLVAASLGQEYCRAGAVHHMQRQGTRLSGIVDIHQDAASTSHALDHPMNASSERQYAVSVELQSPTTWTSTCPCGMASLSLCAHAAALLYQWLTHPLSFTSASTEASHPTPQVERPPLVKEPKPAAAITTKPPVPTPSARQLAAQHQPSPLSSTQELLTQMGLAELRGIAREYEITTNGLNRSQLANAVLAALKQPEKVRHVAATLEKQQRQLLAALTLAGGAMTDEDLRGLFARFSLGQPGQFQSVLSALQSKAMLFRTSLDSPTQARIGVGSSLLDIGWYVPEEIRAALRVTVPVAPFAIEQARTENSAESVAAKIHRTQPYELLSDLLLVARALDASQFEADGAELVSPAVARSLEMSRSSLPGLSSPSDGSVPIPAPTNWPTLQQIERLQAVIARPPEFLGFATQLLRLADILHKDDNGTPYLRMLPNTPQLLLGPNRQEVTRDLFELWLTRSSYGDLYALLGEGLRLRCRATALGVPIVRSEELDVENSEARQSILALLAQAPPDLWISFSSFARFVYRLDPLFLQKQQRYYSVPHWWIELEEGRPLRPLQMNDWLRAEIYYLAHLLTGPLHWWGASEIALAPDGRLLAFRLTELANWLFGDRGEVEEEYEEQPVSTDASAVIEVTSTNQILVKCSPAAWPAIEVMETFLEPAGAQRGRLCYHLSAKAFSEALSKGERPARLLALLRHVAENRAATLEPDSSLARMIEQLEGWITHYGQVRLYSGVTLLEVADGAVMRELAATTAIETAIVHSIHPTLHILKKAGAEQLIDDLKRRGQSPLIHDGVVGHGTE